MIISPAYFALDESQILGAISVFVVAVTIAVLGAIPFGSRRAVEGGFFVGWGVATLIFVMAGALLSLPLTAIAIAIAGFAFVGLGFRVIGNRTFLRALAAWPIG